MDKVHGFVAADNAVTKTYTMVTAGKKGEQQHMFRTDELCGIVDNTVKVREERNLWNGMWMLRIVLKYENNMVRHLNFARRVQHLDQYVSKKLCLDESTDQADLSQLSIFVRTIQEDFTINEEFLSLTPLHGTSKDTDIFEAVQKSIINYGGFDKCSCIITYGVKAMTGTGSSFCGLLKQNHINCSTIQCISHKEVLCVKFSASSQCHESSIKMTNVQGGNRSLSHQRFHDLFSKVDAAYGNSLLRSEIHCLSARKCLESFFAIWKEIPIFLKNDVKSETTKLENQMQDPIFLAALAFITDMTNHMNELNLKLPNYVVI
ncbi:general transcription factor II-I repeat domain-containing protein 2A-like [Protopterus annectens]|uniref:general transcription factor II-I repeat domain-containing protein 2A-like n=1 Tax=Protopterus annectens TaxID=7888 RepID=UPI001CFBA925|nr:general transcription factor II-I repeat domain-containing protein 2A-like [Protopterus annectens]